MLLGFQRPQILSKSLSVALCRLLYLPNRKRENISQLIYRMCETDQVEKLLSFNFAGYADEVEDALAFKARNGDPLVRPNYSQILYSWYLLRGDYRNGVYILFFQDGTCTDFSLKRP